MTHYAQQPVALTLNPDGPQAGILSPLRRLAVALVAVVRPVVRGSAVVQSPAEPFAIAHPWRTWHWFS